MRLMPAPKAITDVESLRRALDRLKSTSLREAETALATAREERAAAARAMRGAIAAMERSRDKVTAEAEVRRLEATLDDVDARVVAARRVRDRERAPLATALRRALGPEYGEAARLVRQAASELQAARDILATAESFAAVNGIDLTLFASRLPSGLDAVVEQLEARAK